jgi:hypothetical protein
MKEMIGRIKRTWTKSNPNLGVTPYISYMDDQYPKSIERRGGKADSIYD